MAVLENTMKQDNYLAVADIDFVNMFGNQIESLQEMLGIQRAQRLNIGDTIKTYKSKVELADGNVVPDTLSHYQQLQVNQIRLIHLNTRSTLNL